MAADFTVVSATRGQELRGTFTLVPVWTIEFVTHPHEVDAVLRIPESQVQAFLTEPPTAFAGVSSVEVQEAIAAAIPNVVQPYATQLEAIAADVNVAALQYLQDVNVADQLIDTIRVFVQQQAGAGTTYFDVPLLNITYAAVAPLIGQAAGALNTMLGA